MSGVVVVDIDTGANLVVWGFDGSIVDALEGFFPRRRLLVNSSLRELLRVAVPTLRHNTGSGQGRDILQRCNYKAPVAYAGLVQVVGTLVAILVFKLAEVAELAASGEAERLLNGGWKVGRLLLVKHFAVLRGVIG